MYERFEPSERIFVDREEYLDWMDDALQRCSKKSVVLHLQGIGGIGKSSLLDHWSNTIEHTVRLDCEQFTEFYDRLNVLAKGAVLVGVQLQRFDVLWQIRQRFVEGVEPVKEAGREWAKEVVMAIPFIGSLASIGSAIGSVGAKVAPKLKGKYGVVGQWLQNRLGKNHVERFLEILWKDPRHAEFLYLDALLEDLNNRKNSESPILFLLDHFEYVDGETPRWRYSGKDIPETELWCVFLSSLSNCVGVMASRRAAADRKDIEIEESELTELDRESCAELLDLRSMSDPPLQEKIISVSGGNPFVIGSICDMAESGSLSLDELESLRAETLEEVRLKTWRRLFSHSQDLLPFVSRAGLLPFFNRKIMDVIAPDLNTDQWDRLLRLSFVRGRDDGTYVLHDLAEELVIAELGEKLSNIADDVAERLEKAWNDEPDFTYLGLKFSAMARARPLEAVKALSSKVLSFENQPVQLKILDMLDVVRFDTDEGWLEIQTLRAFILNWLQRRADCEHLLEETLPIARKLAEKNPYLFTHHLARALHNLGLHLFETLRQEEAEEVLTKAIEMYDKSHELMLREGASSDFREFAWSWAANWHFGGILLAANRLEEAEAALRKALRLVEDFPWSDTSDRELQWKPEDPRGAVLSRLAAVQYRIGNLAAAEETMIDALDLIAEPALRSFALNFLSRIQLFLCKSNQARDSAQEGLMIRKELFREEPEPFWSALLSSHVVLSMSLSQLDEFSEAERILREALDIGRQNAERVGDASSRTYVAYALGELAIILRRTGRMSDAESAYIEYRSLTEEAREKIRERWDEYESRTLSNFGVLLRRSGKISEAEEAYSEAIDRARKVVSSQKEVAFIMDLEAHALNNLGVLLETIGRLSEAEDSLRKAIEVRRTLAESAPEFSLCRLATCLNNLGIVLAVGGKTDQAEEVFLESLQLRRDLVEKSPDALPSHLASTLNNLGVLLKMLGRLEESGRSYRESIDFYESLHSKANEVYEVDLVRALSNLHILLTELNDSDTNDVRDRLEDLGVKEPPTEEVWSRDEAEEFDPF